MLKEPDVVTEFMGGLGNPRQQIQHPAVHLSGIGLARYGIHPIKAHFLSHQKVQLPAFFVVSLEEFQE